MFHQIKLTIFFNIATGILAQHTPETFNILLPSGVKYRITKNVSSCPQKAKIEQRITFRFDVISISGEDVKHYKENGIGHPATVELGSSDYMVPKGIS